MPKYKVDKKMFEQRLLEEQLKQVELQTKYLKDEPLKRSEVDEYNKLKTGGWVRNTLITMGVVFATLIAFIIFVLLGNMLLTNGRSGNVGKYNINSIQLFEQFKVDGLLPQGTPEDNDNKHYLIITYEVPYQRIDDRGTPLDTSDDITYTFLNNPNDDVYVIYEFSWNTQTNKWSEKKNEYNTIGMLNLTGEDNGNYALDVRTVRLNDLMTEWFMGQEDGWAKTLIKDFFFTAWPLTLVFWMLFILSIVGYLILLVVGIRYVIRSVIGILRKAGYIVSDFATEVVDTIKSEIPVVEVEKAEELNISEMTKMLTQKLEESRQDSEKTTKANITDTNTNSPMVDSSPKIEEKPKKTEEPIDKKEKTSKDKINDIFDQ